MRDRQTTTALFLASFCLAAAAGAAPGQDPIDGHRYLPESRWDRLPADAAGQKFYVEGRWHECFGDEVFLFRAPESRGFLFVEGQAIKANLQRNVDSKLTRLEEGTSRVRVFGRAAQKDRRRRGCELVVTRVLELPSDTERLEEELRELDDDPAAYEALAEEAESLAERYDDDSLRALSREITRQELHVRRAQLSEEDHAAALALAERMMKIDDRRGAIALLSGLEDRVSGRLAARVRQRLRRLDAIEGADGWLLYEEYKRSEGFVRVEENGRERWVQRSDLELREARAAEVRRQREEMAPFPRINRVRLLKKAKAGRLARGQNMPEVRLAFGLPAEVRHERAPDANGQPMVWSQWVLEDGRRIYFMDGVVISTVSADEPFPEGD